MEIISYKNIWRVSYPIIIGSIAQNLINVVDTAFLGRLGPIELGAAGNSIIFYFVFIVLGMGFSIGGEIIIGRRNGEKKFNQIGSIVYHCFYCLIPMALLLFVFLKIFSFDILSQVTEHPYILNKSNEYIEYRIYGILFAFINMGFRTFYVGVTQTSILSWSTMVMAGVNIVMDYALIFGHLGFPELGIKGAAIASVLAELSATIYFIIHMYKRVDLKKYNLNNVALLNLRKVKKLSIISAPIMLQNFAAIASWLVFFLIIEKIGSAQLAVSHIIRSIYMVLMIPLFGFAAATNTLVSNMIGAGETDNVFKLVKRISIMSIVITALIIPFNLLIPETMISIYTNDPMIIAASVPVIYVITGSMMLFSVTYILFSAVSGSGNTQMAFLIEFITLIIYLASATYIALIMKASLPIVWCSEFIYFGIMGILAFFYLKHGSWQSKNI